MTGSQFNTVHVIGAGLAGSEAAWQLAKSGVPVVLHEMRPDRMTEAHRTDGLAELVCSIRSARTMPPTTPLVCSMPRCAAWAR